MKLSTSKIILLIYTIIFLVTFFSVDFFEKHNIDRYGRSLIIFYPIYIVFYLLYLLMKKSKKNYNKTPQESISDTKANMRLINTGITSIKKIDNIFFFVLITINFIFSFIFTPLWFEMQKNLGTQGLMEGFAAFLIILLFIFFIILDLSYLNLRKKNKFAGANFLVCLNTLLLILGVMAAWPSMDNYSLFLPTFFLVLLLLKYMNFRKNIGRKYFILLLVLILFLFIAFFPKVSKQASQNFKYAKLINQSSYEQFYKCDCFGYEGQYIKDQGSSYTYYKRYCYGIIKNCVSKGAHTYTGEIIPDPNSSRKF
jgi:hypothetical protein